MTVIRVLTRAVLAAGLALAASACATTSERASVAAAPSVIRAVQATPPPRSTPPASTGSGVQRIGNPYVIFGQTYYPARDDSYDRTGIASWYGPGFHGRLTANGEIFDQDAMTAAHTTLPLPSMIEVTNLENGRSVVLRLNDRGPFAHNRIVDVSRAAAQQLGFIGAGTANVRVRYLGPAGPADAEDRAAQPRIFTVDNMADDPIAARVMASLAPAGAFEGERVAIQAGSFSERENAEDLRRRIAPTGESRVEETLVQGRRFFRVLVGDWPDRNAAETARRDLLRLGVRDAHIVSLR